MLPILALWDIGDGNILSGLSKVYQNSPEKFNVIGATGFRTTHWHLVYSTRINQIYFGGMNQTIVQRAFGAKSLKETLKGLLYTGVLKILEPIIIVLSGVIGF